MASLECIDNELPTYALIERGKTYSGISDVDNFINIGFDVNSNSSTWFSQTQFTTVVNKIKELNKFGNEKFNIYVCDYSAFFGFGLAANAQLSSSQYTLYLCEDGGGTYSGLLNHYVKDYNVTDEVDGPYEKMKEDISKMQAAVKEVTSKTDNTVGSLNKYMGYNMAFAVASLDNVVFLMQDSTRVNNYLSNVGDSQHTTKLLSAFGLDGYTELTEYNLNFKFSKIADRVNNLSILKKNNYLKLMYGKYFDDTYNTLTRTTLDDNLTVVPNKKLIFISSRVKSYPKYATNSDNFADFGFTYVTAASQIPDTYADLDEMYKSDFLFCTEADYLLFIQQLNDTVNYTNGTKPSQDVLDAIRVDCFNYYIDYMFALKFTYLRYGQDYDIILKGHPSEVIGEHQSWTQHYDALGYRYDMLYDNLLLEFHKTDSIGKFIGLVPFGTAAENLAYLGANISLCGLPSSTYTGYDESIDIKFVMSRVDSAIDQNTNLNGRYESGTLKDHNEAGEEVTTAYFNVGNLYKQFIEYYSSGDTENKELKDKYTLLFEAWLRKMNGLNQEDSVEGYDVDNQGFLIQPSI